MTLRARILVVDDEAKNRTLVRAVLGNDHEVVGAVDAVEALQLLAHSTFDLVLLDVMMPVMDGFAACREIKQRFREPYLPVVLLTALADQPSRNLGFEAGADDFLSKPFDLRELLLRVRLFLRLRQQDEQIRHQLDEMRRLDRLKDDLAALLVHDLRNPLAGLNGILWVLRKDASDPDHQEMLDDAMLASRHLRDTIEDMLKIRLLEQQQLELVRAPVSLRALAAEAIASLDGDARARGLSIVNDCSDETLDADASLLRRAIENLLANALRYTRPRTTVTVMVRGGADAVDIMVGDRGPGVPDAFKDQVFEKYGSVEPHAGTARRGNGLGLYLVKLASEAHGGRATVEDRADGGALFRMHLPREMA